MVNQLQELPRTELTLLRSGEENRFVSAVQGRAISKCNTEDVKEVLRLVMLKVGLRAANFPVEEEKAVLLTHIALNYGSHTVQEIALAFDMAIAGKLDLSQRDVVCYENFSCLYFSGIMNAYRAWAAQTHRQQISSAPMIEDRKEPVELSDEEVTEWVNEWKLKEEIITEMIPALFYPFLEKYGKLSDLSSDDKWRYTKKAQVKIKTQLHESIADCKTTDALKEFGEFEKMELDGVFHGIWADRIITLAKKLIVHDYLIKSRSKNS